MCIVVVHRWKVDNPRGAVLCTHGIGSTGAEFAPLAAHLSERGYDVICPDWFGHGYSQYFWRESVYRWENYVRCLATIARKYGAADLHYLGLSWGGMMLMLFLLSGRIAPRSAIFVDVPLRSNPALAASAAGLRIQADAAFDTIEQIEAFLYGRRPELIATPAAWRDYLRGARFEERDGKYVMRFDPAAIATLESYSNNVFDNFSVLDRFDFDCMFLYGTKSPYRDRELFEPYLQHKPNLTYSDILEAAHPPALYEAHQFDPIAAFLERVDAHRHD